MVVAGYDPTAPVKREVKTVSAVLAYISPMDGSTIILVIHQVLYIPELVHNLLRPN
jgi:hypothetical protein